MVESQFESTPKDFPSITEGCYFEFDVSDIDRDFGISSVHQMMNDHDAIEYMVEDDPTLLNRKDSASKSGESEFYDDSKGIYFAPRVRIWRI